MSKAADNSNLDQRTASRHRVSHLPLFESAKYGEFNMEIVNISAQGFMVEGETEVQKGERVIVRLPVIGRIEAHKVWEMDSRSGFQLERVIRLPDFLLMLDHLGK